MVASPSPKKMTPMLAAGAAVFILFLGWLIDVQFGDGSTSVEATAINEEVELPAAEDTPDAVDAEAEADSLAVPATSSTVSEQVTSTVPSTTTTIAETSPFVPSSWARETVESLSLEELVAQLFVVELTPENADTSLANNQWGGVFLILEDETQQDAADFITRIQQNALDTGIGLIVSSDVEGGAITKMPVEPFELPANLPDSDEEITSINRRVAGELCSAGLNLNLAPVADVDIEQNPVLANGRSFSTDPNEVARYIDLFINAYNNQPGPIATTTKHFPGHGATNIDSHRSPANVGTRANLEQFHIEPFQTAIAAYETQPGTIMIGHLIVDDQTEPATFAPEIVNGWLRNDLGYNGVIISDDLAAMEAITDRPPAQRALDALTAGIDILLWVDPAAAEAAKTAVITEITNNPTGNIAQTVTESATRILELKEQLGLHTNNTTRCGN